MKSKQRVRKIRQTCQKTHRKKHKDKKLLWLDSFWMSRIPEREREKKTNLMFKSQLYRKSSFRSSYVVFHVCNLHIYVINTFISAKCKRNVAKDLCVKIKIKSFWNVLEPKGIQHGMTGFSSTMSDLSIQNWFIYLVHILLKQMKNSTEYLMLSNYLFKETFFSVNVCF